MGTSSSGKGPLSITPLIPNWIPVEEPPSNPSEEVQSNEIQDQQDDVPNQTPIIEIPKRFQQSRRDFQSFSKNSSNTDKLKDSLKSYVAKASGGSSKLAKRMLPAVSRVAKFHEVVNRFKDQGEGETLRYFNLENYTGRPLLDVLSALTDIIFDESNPFNNIQDDSISKLAYANTINRIVEVENIDLDTLSNENIEVMTTIFIEETIATRVICDIGTSLFKKENVQEIIQMEEAVYQIVSGLVRIQIMPEIIATQRGKVQNLEKKIQNIYRIAFDCIGGANLED